MNILEALVIVRGSARVSAQMKTRQGRAAGKVIDRKIQSLLRKKAWREGGGAIPVHMGDDNFRYQIPDDPITAALRTLLSTTKSVHACPTPGAIEQLEAAIKQADDAIAGLEPEGAHP